MSTQTNTTFYIFRHGRTDYNDKNLFQGWLPIPLNEEGLLVSRKTAEKVSESLPKPDYIFSSQQSGNIRCDSLTNHKTISSASKRENFEKKQKCQYDSLFFKKLCPSSLIIFFLFFN